MIVLGIKIPLEKKIRIALTTLHGIGYKTACEICDNLNISPTCKTSDLSEKQKAMIINVLRTSFKIEENLRKDIKFNIQKYVDNGSIKGFRHRHGLPVRGQRTHTNGRTQKRRKFKSISSQKD